MLNRWQRLQDIYHSAQALPPESRLEFITAECGGDVELLTEVKELLDNDLQQGNLTAMVAEEVDQLVEQLDEDLVGEIVGPYKLTELVGSGGMGSVYRAERVDGAFEREVAVKLVKKGMDSNRVLARFTYERQVLARLQHANIAALLDGGMTESGQPYFVMEFVAGANLLEHCNDHKLGLRERLGFFQTVCQAVTYAHRNLVVHRDIKPGNILVNEFGEVKLLDFGIAKVLDNEAEDLTQAAGVGYTRGYASPEQIAGRPVSTASDVFSLGVVLYELITGEKPEFPEIDEYGWKARLALPSSRVSDPAVRRALRGDLDRICLHAMAADPQERYGSAAEFAADLDNYLLNKPVNARRATLGYVLGKFVRRHRVGLATSALVVVGFLATIAFYTREIARERDAAILEQQRTAEVVEFVTGLFDVVDPAVSKGEDVSAKELLDSGARQLEFALTDRPLVRAAMVSTLGRVYHALGDMEKALQYNEEALALTRNAPGSRAQDLVNALVGLGAVVQDTGDLERASDLFNEAQMLAETQLGSSHPLLYDTVAARAYLKQTEGEFAEAEAMFTQALDIAEQDRTEQSDEVLAKAMVQLAGIMRLNDKHLEAESLLQDALALQQRIFGDLHPAVADTKRHLAGVYRDTDRWDESIELYKVVIDERTRMLGPHHREVAHTWNSFAQVLTHNSNHDEALAAYDKVLEILNHLRKGKPHVSYPAVLNNRAFALMSNMQHDEALPYFEECLVEMERVGMAEGHPNRTFPQTGIGESYLYLGRYEEAEQIFRRMLEERREHWPEHHRLVTEIKSHLGAALTYQDRFEEAESWLKEALAQHEAAFGPEYRGYHKTLKRLFNLYERSGNTQAMDAWPDFDPQAFTYI